MSGVVMQRMSNGADVNQIRISFPRFEMVGLHFDDFIIKREPAVECGVLNLDWNANAARM